MVVALAVFIGMCLGLLSCFILQLVYKYVFSFSPRFFVYFWLLYRMRKCAASANIRFIFRVLIYYKGLWSSENSLKEF